MHPQQHRHFSRCVSRLLPRPGSRVVVLDPGHGGPEVGAAQGRLAEKNVNLAIALKLKTLLEQNGIQAVLTRDTDTRAFELPDAQAENPRAPLRADLQARVDLANAAGADLFISIHNNGSSNPGEAGAEVWYAPDHPQGEKNWLLGPEVLNGIVEQLTAAGYQQAISRGYLQGISRFFARGT